MSKSDTLDRVYLAPAVFARWREVCTGQLADLLQRFKPKAVPDEQARVEPDGSLTLFVVLPDGQEISMRVEPFEWTWSDGMAPPKSVN